MECLASQAFLEGLPVLEVVYVRVLSIRFLIRCQAVKRKNIHILSIIAYFDILIAHKPRIHAVKLHKINSLSTNYKLITRNG